MSAELNVLLSRLEPRPGLPPARSKVTNAWVYFWADDQELILRADENGHVLRHVSGPINDKGSYQDLFVTKVGTRAQVGFSLGEKPLRRSDIEPQLVVFTLKNDLSDPGGPIFVPRSGRKKVPALPKTHIRAELPSEVLKGDELSFIADYPETWGASLVGESKAVADKIWHPGTRSFREVANTANKPDPAKPKEKAKARTTLIPVSTVGGFFAEIQNRPVNSIRRLNLFTHATPGLISLSGFFEGKDTFLNPVKNNDKGFPFDGGLDGSVVNWLDSEDGKNLRNDLRTRFTKHGEILLFLCHGGLGTGVTLAMDLAAALNVRILAYTQPIGYYVDFPSKTVDRNLTSIGLVPDGDFELAKGTRIKPGYPFVVEVPAGIPDGSHVRPDRTFPKPKEPTE